jgi:hypothetical protein
VSTLEEFQAFVAELGENDTIVIGRSAGKWTCHITRNDHETKDGKWVADLEADGEADNFLDAFEEATVVLALRDRKKLPKGVKGLLPPKKRSKGNLRTIK